MKVFKGFLKLLLVLLLVVVLLLGIYVGYILLQYNRIADYTPLELSNPQEGQLVAGQEYKAMSFNIGFGAYDADFSFFMDEGYMKDGTETVGEHSRAVSPEAVATNVRGAALAMREFDPDFLLLQEVDTASDRSYQTYQVDYLVEAFPDLSYIYASNFHTPFLFWPPTNPIGETESGLVTLARYKVTDSVRRSYPVDESLPGKLFDLDRCFTAQWLPVEGGTGDLVLINSHMSAYDEGGKIRSAQLQMLIDMMVAEYEKGNYVIVGGDFNHALGVALDAFASDQDVPDWLVEMDLSDLPEGFSVVYAGNAGEVPTCRGADIPYTQGVTFTTIVDGFIVSNNVIASSMNVDMQFAYSDHNPVQLTFSLVPGESAPEAPEGGEGEPAAEGGEAATEDGENTGEEADAGEAEATGDEADEGTGDSGEELPMG